MYRIYTIIQAPALYYPLLCKAGAFFGLAKIIDVKMHPIFLLCQFLHINSCFFLKKYVVPTIDNISL